MRTTLDVIERLTEAEPKRSRLADDAVWLVHDAPTELAEFGLFVATAWWAIAMIVEPTFFLTSSAYAVLASHVTQNSASFLACCLASAAVIAYAATATEHASARSLRRGVAFAYACWYGGLGGAIWLGLPGAPGLGFYLWAVFVASISFIRLRPADPARR